MPPKPEFLRLPPQEAIDYFRAKLAIPTETWDQFEAEHHDFAYTVAGLTRADLLEAMRFLMEQAIAEGTSFEDFNKQFDRLIARRGGELKALPAGPDDWRKRVTFNTPITRAYAAGRLKQMRDPAVLKSRPLWQWRHGDSPDPRPNHIALHNKVFPADSKFWDVAYPPCAFGCKCKAFSLKERQVKAMGLTVGTPPDPMTIAEKGFQRAPGTTPVAERRQVLEQGLERLSPRLREEVQADLSRRGMVEPL